MTEPTMAERDARRQPGLYFVQIGDEWTVAEWVRGFAGMPIPWAVIGSAEHVDSSQFTAIDERRLEPPEAGTIAPLPATAPTRG